MRRFTTGLTIAGMGAFLSLLMVRWVTSDTAAPPALDLIFFDVGQGDSSYLRFPNGTSWLIDAGGKIGRRDRGSSDLFSELTRLGSLRVDAAILSHPDQDHGYGFLGVLSRLRIGEMWISGTSPREKPLLRKLHQVATKHSVNVRAWSETASWNQDGVRVKLMPTSGQSSNDRELLVWIEWAGCRILFAGDIEREGEKRLVRSLGPVDLLKVPHHGSKTSSTLPFLNQVRPRWGIVSVGEKNRYGHPNAKVLQRYARGGTSILRTDLHGYLHFEIQRSGRVLCKTVGGSCGESRCSLYSLE